jgi:hypothetical protein
MSAKRSARPARPHRRNRLLLRLRYRDGLMMPGIVRLLQLEGDPYKRINKLIAQLRKACQRAGYPGEST